MENFERANKGLAQYTQSEIDELNKAFEDELRSECYQFMDPFHAEDYTEMTLDEMFREDRSTGESGGTKTTTGTCGTTRSRPQ